MPRACTKGVFIFKVTVNSICQVQRFFGVCRRYTSSFPLSAPVPPFELLSVSTYPLCQVTRGTQTLSAQHSTVVNKQVRCATMFYTKLHPVKNNNNIRGKGQNLFFLITTSSLRLVCQLPSTTCSLFSHSLPHTVTILFLFSGSPHFLDRLVTDVEFLSRYRFWSKLSLAQLFPNCAGDGDTRHKACKF